MLQVKLYNLTSFYFPIFAFIRYLPVFHFTLKMSTAHIYCISLDPTV